MAENLRTSIAQYFRDNLKVIVEPGRYFARSAYTLAYGVIGRRSGFKGVADILYQNDGVYGNFMNVLIEKEVIVPSMAVLGNGKERRFGERSIRFGDRRVMPRIASIESVILGFPGL
jgi:diaminopimelate decarboxylase